MFPCCTLCYEKYIKPDGEIDQSRIKKAAKAAARTIAAGDKSFAEKILEEPCRCDCHKDGETVMH